MFVIMRRGKRVVLQIPQHLIHLIHVALRVVVLHAELVAVGLADGQFSSAHASHTRVRRSWTLLLFELPYPQQLIYRGLPIGAAEREYGELLGQVIAVYYSGISLSCARSGRHPTSGGQGGRYPIFRYRGYRGSSG